METGFFEEAPGVKSLIRRMSYEMFWVANFFNLVFIALFCYTYIKCETAGKPAPTLDTNIMWFDLLLYSLAFFPKVAQKLIEAKFGVSAGNSTSAQP